MAKQPAEKSSPLPRHGAFYIGAAVGTLALVICLFVSPKYAVAVGANMLFAGYLGLTAWEFPALTPEFLRRRAADADTPVGAIFAVTVIAVAVSAAFLFLVVNTGTSPEPLSVATSGVSVLLGWFTIHTMAALHYAYEYFEADDSGGKAGAIVGGLKFPGGGEPDGATFLYFAYVIGMTAQVSDVQVTSNGMRKLVTVHGVLSFFFNTVILAAAVNVAVTLAGS